jgi:glycine/D-amino acid oxidase-like deaminating enzyme
MVVSPVRVFGVGGAKDYGATTTMTKTVTPVDSATVFDTAIIGSGIVGASVACFAAPHGRVLLLEAEAAPGDHRTGPLGRAARAGPRAHRRCARSPAPAAPAAPASTRRQRGLPAARC